MKVDLVSLHALVVERKVTITSVFIVIADFDHLKTIGHQISKTNVTVTASVPICSRYLAYLLFRDISVVILQSYTCTTGSENFSGFPGKLIFTI